MTGQDTPTPGLPVFDLQRLQRCGRDANEASIRQACLAVPLADCVVLCRVLGRYKLYADGTDEGLSPHLILDGYWEMWNTEAMPRFLRAGMTVWDVGANLGYFTLLFAELVGAGGRVHACEPNLRLAGLLRRTLRLNGFASRVQHHAAPLSDVAGRPVQMLVPDGLPQNGVVVAAQELPGVQRTATLDDLVGDGPVDFIKIDADGSEQAIWRGMRRLLARGAPLTVFLEFTPDRYADPAAFLQEMLDAAFALAIVDPVRGIVPAGLQSVLDHAAGHVDRMLILAR